MCYLVKFTTISGMWEDSLTFIQRTNRRNVMAERLQFFQKYLDIYKPINVAERGKITNIIFKHYYFKDITDI